MKIESNAFQNGGEISRKYGYKKDNVNPSLTIKEVPTNAKSLVLIMDDPDAMGAVGKIWVHWVVWNIDPSISEIKENSIPSNSIQGKTDWRRGLKENAITGRLIPAGTGFYINKDITFTKAVLPENLVKEEDNLSLKTQLKLKESRLKKLVKFKYNK